MSVYKPRSIEERGLESADDRGPGMRSNSAHLSKLSTTPKQSSKVLPTYSVISDRDNGCEESKLFGFEISSCLAGRALLLEAALSGSSVLLDAMPSSLIGGTGLQIGRTLSFVGLGLDEELDEADV